MVIKNVGAMDAGIRALVGVALLAVSASLNDRPLLAVGAGLIALVVIGTALFRMCPLYTLLGVTTCPRGPRPSGT
jgi:hypothetical protein